MAQERTVSPEKQLLKVIEQGQAKKSENIQTQSVRHQSLSFLSFSAWVARLSFFRDYFKKRFGRGLPQLDIKLANNLLVLCVAALGIYFMATLYTSIFGLKKTLSVKVASQEEAAQQEGEQEQQGLEAASGFKRSVDYYLEKIRQRDLFMMGRKDFGKANAAKEPTSAIIAQTQNLKLVGISWSNNPDAMIEDTKALRTFFVKRGQMIGDVKVQAIFKDKVILSYGEEEVELK